MRGKESRNVAKIVPEKKGNQTVMILVSVLKEASYS